MLQRDKPQQSQAELAGVALYLPAKLPPARGLGCDRLKTKQTTTSTVKRDGGAGRLFTRGPCAIR